MLSPPLGCRVHFVGSHTAVGTVVCCHTQPWGCTRAQDPVPFCSLPPRWVALVPVPFWGVCPPLQPSPHVPQHYLTEIEVLAIIFAAAIHDYEHTGTTNSFHIQTK